jgi:hypothetical protein
MNKQLVKDSLLWGVVLWAIGYLLGIILFPVVSTSIIGWVIMPIGIAVTLWVLLKKVKVASFMDFVILGVVWTVIAVVFDYFFLVKAFHPADGYYKLDVYIYYALTFLLPVAVGYWKNKK